MTLLRNILAYRSAESGNQTAYTFVNPLSNKSYSITYRELYIRSLAVACALQSCLKPGDRALLLYPAGIDFIIAFFACIYSGIIAVPIYPPRGNNKFSRLVSILKDSEPAALLTIASSLQAVKEGLKDIVSLDQILYLATDFITDEDVYIDTVNIQDENIALLQYTSGSTGSPKGVMVSHQNISHNSACIQKAFQLNETSISVSWLPHFHDMGLIDGIIQPLYSGFHGVLLAPETFVKKPIIWLQLISKFRATHSGGPNSGYEQCIQRISLDLLEDLDLSSWSSAYCGAEPVRMQTLTRFTAMFQACGFKPNFFYPCYGMAEATLMITGGNINDPPLVINVDSYELSKNKVVEISESKQDGRQLVGCGQTWLGTDVKIVDPDLLSPCAEGVVGEIWVASPSVAQGYWQKPELSKQVFQALLEDENTSFYLRTGDLGFIRRGELFIAGRLKDVIIISGQNHYPQDIECSVQACSEALTDNRGAAFSIDRDGQERIIMVQEVKRTHLHAIQCDQVQLFRAIREAVAVNHGLSLEAILLIKPAAIPLTSSGKIQRSECRDRYLANTLPIVAQWPSP